jgi:basic amino acid/polyamine antiporter, APA family
MSKKIGFWSVFAIVTGSQIGSGVFMLPSSLAPYGIFGLFGYLLAGCGILALCFVFASLCSKLPYTGGPHVYIQHAFGPTIGFFSGWTYWVISWVSTTAVIVTSIGCLSPFLVNYGKEWYLVLEIILLAIIAILNLRGVKVAGNAEFFLTILKFIPLIILPVIALFYFDLENLKIDQAIKLSNSNIGILGKVTLLTLWGFIGVETATTPAESVTNPTVTIPKAIIFGTLSVALLYILNFIGIVGAQPGSILMHSKAPYVDVAKYILGGNWHLLISIITSVVCVGTLNAWILTSGQIALGLSQDQLMPKVFGKKNKFDAPFVAIITSSLGIVPLLFCSATKTFAQQILEIIDISVTAFLFIYLLCCASFLRLLFLEKSKNNKKTKASSYIIGLIALVFCSWVIYETPIDTILSASLFIVSGLPLYLFWYRKS